MKKLLLALPVLLAACTVVPPVKKESDLAWTQIVVAGTEAQVFRSIEERTRRCGFLVDTFSAEGSYYPDAKDQALDLRANTYGGASVGVGRLRMTPADGGTLVRIGLPHVFSSTEQKAQALRAVLADPALPCDYEG